MVKENRERDFSIPRSISSSLPSKSLNSLPVYFSCSWRRFPASSHFFAMIPYPLSLNCLLKYSVGNVSPVLWWNSFWRKYSSGELSSEEGEQDEERRRETWLPSGDAFVFSHMSIPDASELSLCQLHSSSHDNFFNFYLNQRSTSWCWSISPEMMSVVFFFFFFFLMLVCLRKMTDDILSYLFLFLMMSSLLFDDKRQQYMKWTRTKTL